MKINREFSLRVQYILDQWIPPRLRDSKWFMYWPIKFVMKNNENLFMTFKDKVFNMTPKQFSNLYARTAHMQGLQGETDLNQACIEEILKTIHGKKILEVGCGHGYLAEKLARKNKVTACDILLSKKLKNKKGVVTYLEANIESLPFKDNAFEYIVTTHTVEHVQHLSIALAELRRVAKDGLIIVVSKQRPYKYTFNLHTQFFPYEWSLRAMFHSPQNARIKDLGDWFYHEQYKK